MPDSSASWQSTPRSAHRALTASSIAGGPTGVDGGCGVAVQRGAQRLGDQAAGPDRTVLGDHRGGASEQIGSRGVGRRPEAHDHAAGHVRRLQIRRTGTAAARRRCRRPPAVAAIPQPAGGSPRPAARAASAAPRRSSGRGDGCRGRRPRAGSPGPRHPPGAGARPRARTPAAGTGARPLPHPTGRPRRACRTGPAGGSRARPGRGPRSGRRRPAGGRS